MGHYAKYENVVKFPPGTRFSPSARALPNPHFSFPFTID
jgi:hypothetical protein